jgi:large subunit ribosomal protein L6e
MPSSVTKGRTYKQKGLWVLKAKNGGKFPVRQPKKVDQSKTTSITKKFGKKGESRTVVRPREARLYPTEDVVVRRTRKVQKAPVIRTSLQAGTVAIALSGQFRGKRVVVLKRLESGLVLVTGPFKINGVPLRRYNPAYLIATSTTIDLTGVSWGESESKLNDAYFQRPANAEKKAADAKKVTDERVQLQKAVDTQLLVKIKQTPLLKEYLGARYSITKGQAPHSLKF